MLESFSRCILAWGGGKLNILINFSFQMSLAGHTSESASYRENIFKSYQLAAYPCRRKNQKQKFMFLNKQVTVFLRYTASFCRLQ